jgi:hypothetical protein
VSVAKVLGSAKVLWDEDGATPDTFIALYPSGPSHMYMLGPYGEATATVAYVGKTWKIDGRRSVCRINGKRVSRKAFEGVTQMRVR